MQLINYFTLNKLFTDCQYGLRPNIVSEYYGITNIYLKLFRYYLSGRKQFGFIGFISDLLIFSINFNIIMYEDDTTFYANIVDFHPVTFEDEINEKQ